jgi:hypothetical protein
MVFALMGFRITAKVDSDEPMALASRNDLTNFARHEVPPFLRNQAHSRRIGDDCRFFVAELRLMRGSWTRSTHVARGLLAYSVHGHFFEASLSYISAQ